MPIPVETPERILNYQNLPARVYEMRKDRILRGLLPSGARLYEDELASGETLGDPEGVSAYLQADLRFHLALLDACGNRELTQIMQGLHDRSQMLRLRTVTLPGRVKASLDEHLRIIAAIERGDPDLAEGQVREHIRKVRVDVLKVLGGRADETGDLPPVRAGIGEAMP